MIEHLQEELEQAFTTNSRVTLCSECSTGTWRDSFVIERLTIYDDCIELSHEMCSIILNSNAEIIYDDVEEVYVLDYGESQVYIGFM